MKSLMSIALLLLVGCATALKAPSGFVRAGETPVWCAAEDAATAERAWNSAADIVRRVEGREYSGGKVVLRWTDESHVLGSDRLVGYVSERKGGWEVKLGQAARSNLIEREKHEFVHCITGKLGHDVRYDPYVFEWQYSREVGGR